MSKCKYYLEKEVVSYDGGITWNETGVTRKGNLYEEGSEDCTDPSVQYRWINMDVTTDYICDGTNKYYKQKKQVSYDGIIWQDVTPAEYQRGSIYEVNSPDCQPTYRWVNMDISTDYICDETTYTKYYKQKKQVSYGGQEWQDVIPYEYQRGDVYETQSTDCGYTPEPIYRWINMDISTDYICDGTTKYYKQKKQVSYDGIIWQDVTPAEYQRGSVYETQSTDCGYVPPIDLSAQCLTFVANEDSTVRPYNFDAYSDLYVSFDSGQTWSISQTLLISLEKGESVMMRYVARKDSTLPSSHIEIIGNCSVMGNPLSVYDMTLFDKYVSGGTIDISKVSRYAYGLFRDCRDLTDISNLFLPTFNGVVPEGAFGGMFSGCTSLTTVPKDLLHGVSLGSSCYASMFENCTSLTAAPDLPALTLACGCYHSMFKGCTSLTTAPDLPALTLPNGCGASVQTYAWLFYGCTSLNYIKCLSNLNNWSYLMTDDWVYNVSPTGTFIKKAGVDWPTGDDGIPEGWTIIDA